MPLVGPNDEEDNFLEDKNRRPYMNPDEIKLKKNKLSDGKEFLLKCRIFLATGNCDLKDCKFSHNKFDGECENQKERFFEENLGYLIDLCRKRGSLAYYNDEFLLFIQKRVNKDPGFMDNKGGP